MEEKKKPSRVGSLDEILAEVQLRSSRAEPPEPQSSVQKADRSSDAAVEEKGQTAVIPVQRTNGEVEKGKADPPQSRGRRGLFGRRKEALPDEEEDIYYGLQLRPLEEYQKQYQKTLMNGEPEPVKKDSDSVFSYLFSDDDEAVDKEISERFARLHREREERVRSIVRETGETHDIFSFFPNNAQENRKEEAKDEKDDGPKDISSGRNAEPLPFLPLNSTKQSTAQPEEALVSEPTKKIPAPILKAAADNAHKGAAPVTAPTAPTVPREPQTPMVPYGVPEFPSDPGPREIPPVSEPLPQPRVLDDTPPKAPIMEPPARKTARSMAKAKSTPPYRDTGRPVHIVDWDMLDDALSLEAKSYPKTKKTTAVKSVSPVAAPQTISFPGVRTVQEKPQPPLQNISVNQVIPLASVPHVLENETQEEEEPETEHRKKGRFRITGGDEPENDPNEELPKDEEELDDYQSPADAPSVAHDIGTHLHQLMLRLAVTGICTVLLLAIGLFGESAALLSPFLHFSLPPQTGLILNLVFLFIACVFSLVPILSGLKSLLRMKSDSDSAAALAALTALIQAVVLVFQFGRVEDGTVHSYAVLASAALFLNTAGKLSMIRRIGRNFRFVSSPGQKYAVQIFDDHNTALQMTKDCVIGTPVVAFQTRANFLKRFLSLSYEQDPSDQSASVTAPIGCILSLLLFIGVFVLTKDGIAALSALTLSCCVCTPFLSTLCVNLPLSRISKLASRCGAMLVGFPAVDQFSAVNALMLDAKDLFPRGTVVLNGIKTFGDQRVDEAILDATALMTPVGGPLSDLFDQIIKSRRDILPKAQSPVYEDGLGVSGNVEGRPVLIGNRHLLEAYGIAPPSRDYEDKYRLGGKQLVYLAIGGELVAMFLVSYESDRRRSLELRRLEDNGVSLVVRTCDPNITAEFLADCFQIDAGSVRVLPERLGSVYADLVEEPQERADALIATKGRPTAMMRLIAACIRQRGNITLGVALQNVAIAIGFVLVALLSCWSGQKQLSTLTMLLYELFWIAAIYLFPRIRRP